jgi:hypothetical protein
MAAIYSNGGNRWNIIGFNFTKRDALSSVYKISMLVTFHSEHVFYDNANQRPLGPTHGRDEMKVTERIRAVCSCFCKRAPCEFCHLSCFFCQIKKNKRRFPINRFPIRRQTVHAKQASNFLLFNCPTPHSSNHKDSQLLLRKHP